MARFFSRTRREGKPADVRTRTTCNGDRLAADRAHAFSTPEALMADDSILELLADPVLASQIDDWMVVEYEADAGTQIVPDAGEQMNGVYVVPLAEIERTPLLAFIDHYVENGNPAQQDAAGMLQTLAEVALE